MKKLSFIIFCGLILLTSLMLAVCDNPVMERWWGETAWPVVSGGDNFGVVVFDSDGGTPQPKAIKLAFGGVVGRLRPTIKSEHGFTGWFDEQGGLWDVETQPVTKADVNSDGILFLKAGWESSPFDIFTVTFYTGASPTIIPDQLISRGAKIIAPVIPAHNSISYGFGGWEDEYNTLWDFNNPVTGNMTLTARWSSVSCLVTFEANGGLRPDGFTVLTHEFAISIDYGVVPHPGPLVKDDHIFGGWFTDNGTFIDQWDFASDRVTSTNPLTLYAKWIPQFPPEPGPGPEIPIGGDNFGVVVFDSDGGTPQPKAIKLAFGGVVGRLRPITKSEHGFTGWFDEQGRLWDVETQPVTKADVNSDGILLLKAGWEPFEVFTVSFITNDPATTIPPQLIASGGKIVPPLLAAKLGYGFDGWENEYNTLWDFNNPVTRNMTLIAKWHSSFCIVRFEANDGRRPDGFTILTHEFAISTNYGVVPHPGPLVKDDHIFGGWFTDNETFIDQWDFASDRVTAGTPSPLTLYAKWIPQFRTIIFDQNGGEGVSPNTFVFPVGSRLSNPGAPARVGHIFLGWFHDPAAAEGTGLKIMDYTVPPPIDITDTDPIYFYAGWRTSRLYVTFNIVGSGTGIGQQATQLVDYGERAARPVIEAIPGRHLDGKWFTDSNLKTEWNFDNNRITANRDLYTASNPDGFPITFDLRDPPYGTLNFFTAPETQHVPTGGVVIEPYMPPLPASEMENRYSFLRWDYIDSHGNLVPYDFNTPVIGALTLYARWVPPVPDMVWVPRGSFIMGDAGVSGSPAAYHAYPTRRVTLDGFYISKFLVTQEEYLAKMGINPSQFTGNPRHPVENVSWHNAVEFLSRLGSEYRLPTEAEWEFAARGGANPPERFLYAGSNNAEEVAWFNVTVAKEPLGSRTTQEVGRLAPNSLGIYDMSGNLSEWCFDLFAPYTSLQGSGPHGVGPNPKGADPNSGAAQRVRRGGSWNNAVGNVRIAVRNSEDPNNAHWAVGFRIVRNPTAIY